MTATSELTRYRVIWIIDTEAENPIDAAKRARDSQLEQLSDNSATCFVVRDTDTDIECTVKLGNVAVIL
jgi:hypothetical protein